MHFQTDGQAYHGIIVGSSVHRSDLPISMGAARVHARETSNLDPNAGNASGGHLGGPSRRRIVANEHAWSHFEVMYLLRV